MKNIFLILLFIICLGSLTAVAQTDSLKISELNREDIIKMSSDELLALPFADLIAIANKLGITIDELLKMKTSVASKTELTPRETPGIVSIVTREDIQKSGARDLIEVLRMVPGINFAYDDGGVIGMHMRGNWGHEGKVLLIIDGLEMNELKYNTLQFGRHFDVNSIKRIEVIRGPGSSIYGGSAELGVINITTEKGKDINGIKINSGYSQMGSSTGLANVGISAGKKINDFELSFHGNFSDGIKSDKNYISTDTFNLANGGASTRSAYANLGINWKNLESKFIFDNFEVGYINNNKRFTQSFSSVLGEFKYNIRLGDKLLITPKVNYKHNVPYFKDYKEYPYNYSVSRYSGNLNFTYQTAKNFDLVGGVEYYTDLGNMISDSSVSVFKNGNTSTSNNTFSAYLQSIVKTKLSNLIIGGRFDHHNIFGNAYAPRVGLTRSWSKFHYKLLFSIAFRSPTIGNLDKSNNLKPERTYVTELELGYKLNDNMFLTTNFFNMSIWDPIIWSRFSNIGSYSNSRQTGTRGFEIEYRAKYTKGFATLNYSYYKTASNTVMDYKAYNQPNIYVGAPAHKITLLGSYNFTNSISISPAFIYTGKNYHIISAVNNKIDPALICNLHVHFTDIFIEKLHITLGINDLFNQAPPFVQAYSGFQKPFPSPSREYCIKLAYTFGLN